MNHPPESKSVPLKQATKHYFAEQSLNSAQFDNLQQLLGEHAQVAPAGAARSPSIMARVRAQTRQALFAVAASLLLLVLFNVNNSDSPTHVWDIANEVAVNHIKMKPLEVKSRTLVPLRDYFTQLDFSVIASQRLASMPVALLGGRYCSIQGVSAARLRYQQADGPLVTLYEVPFDPILHKGIPQLAQGQEPLDITVRGIAVSLWVEHGLLMAQVSEITATGKS
ncbi:hypothetical protein [Shewanella waksmanii]|uniref:hypothetical protein n=1 Tax=Shewanella waksmanii TaxID=213783 RepID=UPI0004B40D22|nr:hypothetical protein [Shewanella waksmanii]